MPCITTDAGTLFQFQDSKMSSPTLSSSDTLPSSSSASNSSESGDLDNGLNTKCGLCNDTFTIPKVLGCFHTFCQPCLEKISSPEKVVCPDCHLDTQLSSVGVEGLLPDYCVSNTLEEPIVDSSSVHCTGCKTNESNAVARCFDCANYLCPNCVMAHQFMHCFEGHRVIPIADLQNGKEDFKHDKPVYCLKHKGELLRYFCQTCNAPICKECTTATHAKGHEFAALDQLCAREMNALQQLAEQAKVKANDLRASNKTMEHTTNRLQTLYTKAEGEIHDTANFYASILEDRKQDALKELESAFNSKLSSLTANAQRVQGAIDCLYQGCEFIEKLTKHASPTEILIFKKMIDTKLNELINFMPEITSANSCDLEFVSNYQAIQVGVRNTFGYIRQSASEPAPITAPPPCIQPIARPIGTGVSVSNGHHNNGFLPRSTSSALTSSAFGVGSSAFTSNGNHLFDTQATDFMSSKNQFPATSSLSILPPTDTLPSSNIHSDYTKWSNAPVDIFQSSDFFSSSSSEPSMNDVMNTAKILSNNTYPTKSTIKRQKMIYHCKFGEFGVMEGQFTEPSGVAVNAQNDIIVADTNNHRIQIFDKEGRFKFQFGECGKRDGQLLYPNRVAVIKNSGDIVVTERSPTHQVQIYNQYGQFERKFGANILQHPRGVTVDNRGRIIIVECKVMRVIIFSQDGQVLQKFGCSKHLEFPNGVVVNDKEEIFISDNRAHCVKVFDYQGHFLRQIGKEGITNYPIGVGINSAGDILIADNHNNFNLTVFTQDGQLLSAFESKVKHAQCFDVALMDDGSVVLASKDYRLYIYRYSSQNSHIGMIRE